LWGDPRALLHARQLQFPLPLETFERTDGLVGSVFHLLLNLRINGMANEIEKRTRETKNDQQGSDKDWDRSRNVVMKRQRTNSYNSSGG